THTSRSWGPRKVAVTCWYSEIGTSHGPVPVQAPIHPVKMESGPDIAVRLTTEFIGGDVEHICVAPGVLAHVVAGGGPSNVAWTENRLFTEIWQVPVPEQLPAHPANVESAAGAAVSVTVVGS